MALIDKIACLPFSSCFDVKPSKQRFMDDELAEEINQLLLYRHEVNEVPGLLSKDRIGVRIGADSPPQVVRDEQKKVTMRVKVKMTKQEARRLLSKCKEGGLLEFKDVARELARIPMSRVVDVKSMSANRIDMKLESTTEERWK